MFRTGGEANVTSSFQKSVEHYPIQKNDLLELEVYSNDGQSKPEISAMAEVGTAATAGSDKKVYMVNDSGMVKFPVIPELKVEGLSLSSAENLLQNEFQKFYPSPFVRLKFANKRAVVLGASGGHVVSLSNEQMKLAEVLALATGVGDNAKASNIRILRGQEVMVADLSTVAGYRDGNVVIQPNDIIYLEPIRRPIPEALRDYGPLFSIITSIATLVVVLLTIDK
jgi:polysaccharide biosynthesis/export protein